MNEWAFLTDGNGTSPSEVLLLLNLCDALLCPNRPGVSGPEGRLGLKAGEGGVSSLSGGEDVLGWVCSERLSVLKERLPPLDLLASTRGFAPRRLGEGPALASSPLCIVSVGSLVLLLSCLAGV